MLTRRVIPCLDIRDGRVVKGRQFRDLRDAGDPVALAERYEREGADELTLLDVTATLEDRSATRTVVSAVRNCLSIPLMVGGGVRSVADVARLLAAGADKVSLNTAAVLSPELLTECADRFGSQCVVVAIDVTRAGSDFNWSASDRSDRTVRTDRSGQWQVVIRSGTTEIQLDAVEWAARAADLGAGEILLTSRDRDGTGHGFDLELIAAVAEAVAVPVIASGGASCARDFFAAFEAGADAALAAGIFHSARITLAEVKQFLENSGVEVRR